MIIVSISMEAASHVCENFSKGNDCFDKEGCYTWCLLGSYAESIYLYLMEPAGETSI